MIPPEPNRDPAATPNSWQFVRFEPGPERPPISPTRLLLIEDNEWDARLAREALDRAEPGGFDVEWCARLRDGLTRLARGDIEVVLLDLSLPDSVGLSTVERLRAEAPNMPLLVLTGHGDDTAGRDSIKMGADDFLVKDRLDPQLLARAVRYAMERGRFQQERRAALEWKRELEHLREIDRLRSLFMGLAAQKLQEPLLPLRDDVESLRERAAGGLEESSRQSLSEVERRLEELRVLIASLAEVARLQSGLSGLERAEFDLNELVLSVLRRFEERARVGGIRLDAWVTSPVTVVADRRRVEDVLRNLLDNALKFTPEGGEVVVEASAQPERVVVRVRDTGIGFRPDDVPRMFQPVTRPVVDPSRPEPPGLGLYVSRAIVEFHGGRIWGESDGPGRGSTFSFELPCRTERVTEATGSVPK